MQYIIRNSNNKCKEIAVQILIYLLVIMLSVGLNTKTLVAQPLEQSAFILIALLWGGLIGLTTILLLILLEYGVGRGASYLRSSEASISVGPYIIAQIWQQADSRAIFQKDQKIGLGIYNLRNQKIQVALVDAKSEKRLFFLSEKIPDLARDEFWQVYIGYLPSGDYQIILYDQNKTVLDQVIFSVY